MTANKPKHATSGIWVDPANTYQRHHEARFRRGKGTHDGIKGIQVKPHQLRTAG